MLNRAIWEKFKTVCLIETVCLSTYQDFLKRNSILSKYLVNFEVDRCYFLMEKAHLRLNLGI